MIGVVLVSCGALGALIGAWRGYAAAREAIAPLTHAGDPTRTAIEATRPLLTRPRVRLFARRLMSSVAWITVALYSLFMVAVGLEVNG